MRPRLASILMVPVAAISLMAAQPPNIPGSQAHLDQTESAVRPEKGRSNHNSDRAAVSPHKAKRPQPYQIGKASWYGKQFHGKETASGERYDMFQFTAAHRQLPLGTLVKVTNLRNGRSVIVRVNDRGPVPRSRIIDLSYGAARILELPGYGVETVQLDIVRPATVALYNAKGQSLPGMP
ncbi:MAG TPA: septal ring lytic transglycosylase RlpA family protein [Terriglobales bacterium]|nr:septal ring lytic transglycosylase RlpA family protein [Terriglobales bacterium]